MEMVSGVSLEFSRCRAGGPECLILLVDNPTLNVVSYALFGMLRAIRCPTPANVPVTMSGEETGGRRPASPNNV
ncbi:hypothetical protein EYF80_027324 [Liparis tanakae]|uniref:Uncharacterized protein n=1 Tax=Liparis tanakae TaxID=230148 RepID=A0A4Z2H9H7_9TELE|nr:hypothetical protein EYF80_027324 [Liparis tanakae]